MKRHKEQPGGMQLEMVMPEGRVAGKIGLESGGGALGALEQNLEFIKSQQELQAERDRLRMAVAEQPAVVERFRQLTEEHKQRIQQGESRGGAQQTAGGEEKDKELDLDLLEI